MSRLMVAGMSPGSRAGADTVRCSKWGLREGVMAEVRRERERREVRGGRISSVEKWG